ncbi:xylonate dehydratase [Microdochium nivale]|nr:xylonate dehydratase [Microdochium nivale]
MACNTAACADGCAPTATTPCSTANGHNGSHAAPDMEDYKAEISRLNSRVRELQSLLGPAPNLASATPSTSSSVVGDDTRPASAHSSAPTTPPRRLRSSYWFDRKEDPALTALYTERYLNYGLTSRELKPSGGPKIGIAQSGSDLAPCNRHGIELAQRIRAGIIAAGGVPFEFPMHPIQETARRPTAALDRNLAALSLTEVLHGYPLDGVVMITGCDKTTPACLMAAATVNLPAICFNVGPMLNGWSNGKRIGSGTVIWEARERYSTGEIDADQVLEMIASGTPSPGHCNTMGTALTMNIIAETLGMALPGSAVVPAVYRERSQLAFETGLRIVDMVRQNVLPLDIMKREAFENAIVATTLIGGSSNAVVHLKAIAEHANIPLSMEDWYTFGYGLPLLVNMQPAGEMLSEDFHRAGGLPAVLAEAIEAGRLPHPDAMTVNGKTLRQNAGGKLTWDRQTIKSFSEPIKQNAGFLPLTGTLFDSAIMKTSVISPEFRKEFLDDPASPNAFEGPVAVFDGPEDYHNRLETATITRRTILVMRGVGPLGYPGSAEVVNMQPPSALLKQGIRSLPCIGDGRQSGTSGSPSILHVTPEAATEGSKLALLRDGDMLRIDLNTRRVDLLMSEKELAARRKDITRKRGRCVIPQTQTGWQDIHRREVSDLSEGMVFKRAKSFHNIAQMDPIPRDNH